MPEQDVSKRTNSTTHSAAMVKLNRLEGLEQSPSRVPGHCVAFDCHEPRQQHARTERARSKRMSGACACST
eukprot:15185564-Alexandrium_andersonii.AAC.1